MAALVERLERAFAAWLGVSGAVATGFGRGALAVALEALGARGSDVLVPDFICAQALEAVSRSGARAVFYPVGRDLSVSPDAFRAALTPQTRSAILAHYFGRAVPQTPAVAEICRDRGILLIEDCALALGASLGNRRVGTFGHAAVFSFSKSDWCYGGGVLTSNSAEWVERARAIREREWAVDGRLSFAYGLLRRCDFAANRPYCCGVAERAGRGLERALFRGTARREGGNFYDAGRLDVCLPGFGARRARRVLAGLAADTARRRAILQQLLGALERIRHILLRREDDPGDAASFLALENPAGRAYDWVQQAARASVTLRLCWPAYQRLAPGQASENLSWLAEHVLLLEIHPRLSLAELGRVVRCLCALAGRQ